MSSPSQTTGVQFNPVQGRKRSPTKTLLGAEYEETVTSILDPPLPLQNLQEYTAERIRESLRYADTTLRHPERKISPAGCVALGLYKDACAGLLDMLDVEEGETFDATAEERKTLEDANRTFLREAEKAMQINACMKATNTESAQELQQAILDLQHLAFYARYGDYFSEICTQLKIEAEKKKIAGWQTLSKSYWSEISQRVEDERPVYEQFLKGVSGLQEKMPTTYAIRCACYVLGLNPNDTMEIVKQYGIRNDLLHANLLPFIKKGEFDNLAKRIHNDRIDISLLIPFSEKNFQKILEQLLEAMIDLWFEKDDLDPSNYHMWTRTDALKDSYKELNNPSRTETEAQVNQKIAKEIAKSFKNNLKISAKVEEMNKLFHEMTGKKLPPKRVASSQLDEERENLKQRKKKWDAILNLANQAKSLYDAYILSSEGEVGEPREVVEDEDL